MAKKKSSILVNTLVLVIVTVVAVFLLAVVNQVTRGPIEEAEINARAEVYKVVYPNSEFFAEVEDSENLISGSEEALSSAGYEGCYINDVLAVTDESKQNIKGYVISATSPSGYGGDLEVAVGITTEGEITGMNVVSNSETAGIGSKCTEPDFTSQFAGKKAAVLEYTSSGATADNEIDAVSGATITTNAVTEAVNAAIVFYQTNFGGGLEAEEAEDPMQKAFPDADMSTLTPYEFTPVSTDEYTVDDVQTVGEDGYIITVTAHNAYAGDLKIALGVGNDSMIKGFSVLESNETKPLGGQCTSDEFAQQFVGMKAEEVKYVPSAATVENNEIDLIAGATITTNAVVTAVNGAVDFYNSNLKGE